MLLYIDHEYGFEEWYAELTEAEWAQLQAVWPTIRNMSCCVPVSLIVPQAVQFDDEEPDYVERASSFYLGADARAHFHAQDDSHLNDVRLPPGYRKPGESFEMGGRAYDPTTLFEKKDAEWAALQARRAARA